MLFRLALDIAQPILMSGVNIQIAPVLLVPSYLDTRVRSGVAPMMSLVHVT